MEKIGIIGLGVAVCAFAYGGLQVFWGKKYPAAGSSAERDMILRKLQEGNFTADDDDYLEPVFTPAPVASKPQPPPVGQVPLRSIDELNDDDFYRDYVTPQKPKKTDQIPSHPEEDGYQAETLPQEPVKKEVEATAIPKVAEATTETIIEPSEKQEEGAIIDITETKDEPLFDEKSQKEMEAILVGSGRTRPTKSQWQVITSTSLNTRVVAGAGSGKSTCLSLRVVYMHKYLGIPLDQITVVTFTKNSRKDFIEKLTRDFADFYIAASPWVIKSIVRTFHSLLIAQSIPTSGGTGPTFFEQQGEQMPQGDDFGGIVADPGALNPRQMNILRQVFAECFYTDGEFKRIIIDLMMLSFDKPASLQYEDSASLEKAIAVASKRDQALVVEVNRIWTENLRLSIPGVEWGATAIKNSRGDVWHANGRLKDSGIPIILGNSGLGDYAGQIALPIDNIRNFGFINTVRLKVLSAISTEHYIYIENKSDLARLQSMLAWCDGALTEQKSLPAFELHLAGERKPYSIFELLYKIASFITSMGLDVVAASREISSRITQDESHKIENHVCLALAHFWPVFIESLKNMGMTTYDELFINYSDKGEIAKEGISKFVPMTNLLIDEFQDISGQIIRWIINVQDALRDAGATPSLMAVGDDWQSIFAWRGSDPDFLINFSRYFPDPTTLVMPENFRSGQMIIDAAEVVTSRILDRAVTKHGVSQITSAVGFPAVFMGMADDVDIKRLVALLVAKNPSASIFVLSRTNEGLLGLLDLAKEYPSVSLHTLHRAKGLESDHVIIKGDCLYSDRSLLKNEIYDLADMPKFYDASQRDEAFRLAYVGITRARRACYWFLPKGSPVSTEGAFSYLAEKGENLVDFWESTEETLLGMES